VPLSADTWVCIVACAIQGRLVVARGRTSRISPGQTQAKIEQG
jgi:hypothetical protein